MPQSEPFLMLPSAGLERAARSCPLLDGKDTEEWIACCSLRFFPLAKLIARDNALAEDALQESWIKILQNINSYVGGPPACPWVRAVVANTAKDARRAFRRAKEVPLFDVTDPAQDLEAPVEQQQMLRLLRETIAVLPEIYRQVMELRLYGELSIEQTAERLHISRSDVSVRLRRAVDMLKKRIDARLQPQNPPGPERPEEYAAAKGSWLHHKSFRQRAVTSALGNVRFPGVPPGRIIVRAKTPEESIEQRAVAVTNQELRLTLRALQ